VRGTGAAYGLLRWDRVEGELAYSPQELRLARARAQRGAAAARLDLGCTLTDWAFRAENPWSLEAELDRAPSDDLQSFFGTAYPVRALVSGQFRAGGTRGAPELTALVDLTEIETQGFRFDRARSQVRWDATALSVNNAEIRKATGRITGNVHYGLRDGRVAFDAAGAVIPIEQLEPLQTAQVPLGGQISFQLKGSGLAAAPQVEGSLRVVDLRAGKEVLGSFESRVRADGRQLRLELTSAMTEGALGGSLDLTLAGQYPLRGHLTLRGIDLDPFLVSALHLPHESFTGHSRVDGRFTLTGELLQPGEIAVGAEIARLTLGYESVVLESDGPVKLAYRAQEVRIEQARLKGADTDFEISGFARFNGDRRLGLQLSGLMNLQLLGGFVPDLEARGSARVNTTFEGTTTNPRITGRVRVEEAAAQLGDFPAGLSRIRGDLVFDRSRLLLESVSAEAGGGRLALGGSVTYGEGPLRYDLTIGASRVRIRYPQGMSWLGSGALRFAGSTRSAVLSGRITLERLLLSQGFDFASLLAATPGGVSGAPAASPFVRNLQFDIEVVSAPDARMEWAAARFDCEAQLRVRGTWEHPILLGHIHLLSGEMTFRGNRYTLTRGDINFANPFRIDPVLNLEAVTAIRQYEVTLNFAGPASRLTLAHRSDPPLPPSDVVELLALGRTADQGELRSEASRSTESGASALLGEAVSSQIGGRIERLFGVSRFRIDPFLAGTGTEQNASARITIEQQVARDLVITYITNVSSTQQQVIQVEYAVNRDVSIIALRDQNGTFGLDVKFKKRFK
jgi:translocation and assembly module TamB